MFERDGWRCTVPGCTAYRTYRAYCNLHAHHLEPRSAGGSDDLDNVVTLCAFHHLRDIQKGKRA